MILDYNGRDNLLRKIYTLTLLYVFLLCFSVTTNANMNDDDAFGQANEYGDIVPSDVYAILDNVNLLVMKYIALRNPDVLSQARQMKAESVSGKTPNHAYGQLMNLSDLTDKLLAKVQLLPMKRTFRKTGKAIPAEVYLQATNNLDALVELMSKLQPDDNWGDYYGKHKYSSPKVPSDVYAYAKLLVDRLNLVLQG